MRVSACMPRAARATGYLCVVAVWLCMFPVWSYCVRVPQYEACAQTVVGLCCAASCQACWPQFCAQSRIAASTYQATRPQGTFIVLPVSRRAINKARPHKTEHRTEHATALHPAGFSVRVCAAVRGPRSPNSNNTTQLHNSRTHAPAGHTHTAHTPQQISRGGRISAHAHAQGSVSAWVTEMSL
jgi:hypothetical protein